MKRYIDIVFDGPPNAIAGRFVEVENENGAGINFGEWVHREDGYWALRFIRRDLSIDEFIKDSPLQINNFKLTERLTIQANGHGGFRLIPVDEEEAVPQLVYADIYDQDIKKLKKIITGITNRDILAKAFVKLSEINDKQAETIKALELEIYNGSQKLLKEAVPRKNV